MFKEQAEGDFQRHPLMGSPMWHRLRTVCRKEVVWNVVLLKAGQESTPGFARLFVFNTSFLS